jgi:hypothetical protein
MDPERETMLSIDFADEEQHDNAQMDQGPPHQVFQVIGLGQLA